MRRFVIAAFVAAVCCAASADDKKDDKTEKEMAKLLEEIPAAMKDKKYADVVALAKKAEALDPKHPAVPLAAATARTELRQHAEAEAEWTKLLALLPKEVAAYHARGDARLKGGKFKEAVADFDEYLKTNPKFAPKHWRRGIALYYAGQFKEGVAQFELHRTANPEDVENSAWHYLCNARANTPKKAREELIPVTEDARVPMNKVLELFAGKAAPKDVLDAAENAKLKDKPLKEARFYAHLYVALYYESEGDAKKCQDHLTEAVEKYPINEYMYDVAAAHLKLLKAKK